MKTALLLVDLQNDYFHDGRMELEGMDAAASRARALLEFFRQTEQPIVHVRHTSLGERATFFVPGTEGAGIHASLQPAATETVIEKHYPNSFRDTELLECLQTAEVNRLVIGGAMSHMCIDATTRAAADLGYSCVVIHDACATRKLMFEEKAVAAAEVHAAFMAALQGVYAQVTSCESFLEAARSEKTQTA